MPVTRADAESLMVRRLGRSLAYWGLDGTTADGTNADVGPALSRALVACGVAAASPLAPTGGELALLPAADVPKFLDLAHLHLLEACLDHADVVREREGVNEQEWNGRVAELRRRLDQKAADVASRYGDGGGVGVGGMAALSLGFLQPEPTDP